MSSCIGLFRSKVLLRVHVCFQASGSEHIFAPACAAELFEFHRAVQHLCKLLTKSRQLWRRRPWGWQKKQVSPVSLECLWSKGQMYGDSTSPLPHLSCKCSLFSHITGQISNLIHKIRQIFHIYWSWNWCKHSCNQWDFPHNEDYWGSAGGKVWRRWRHRLASQQVASEIARFPSRDSVFPYRRHSRRQGGHQGWGPGGGEAVWKLWAEGNQSNEREFTSLDLLPWCLRKITLS